MDELLHLVMLCWVQSYIELNVTLTLRISKNPYQEMFFNHRLQRDIGQSEAILEKPSQ